jgi:hypothetical protein
VNLLGLSLGVDPVRPALKLPALGRLGMAGLWSGSHRSLRLLRQEMLHDLPAGGAPHAGERPGMPGGISCTTSVGFSTSKTPTPNGAIFTSCPFPPNAATRSE